MSEQQENTLPSSIQKIDKDVANTMKVTFYLTEEQIDKLEDLVHECRKTTKNRRINRSHIIRYLVDQCTIETLIDS